MTSQHSSSDGFSPLFSNVTASPTTPAQDRSDTSTTRKRSEPNGDHHLTFLDLADSDPADR
ncbi:hypothetical protein SAMN04515671_3474 [Nakamurella panacisegetis]|uniref:Uncharacterized protein n=1 Tax=Nakamurella panacisegetis TaxID=1090615 RepID=A0A1H0RAK1_9ACTN|nr:hypothetical protein [Nakamurella panacisegetis]SDP26593.1 hypothetical protein SAMN04515671_3474 [Nakamurella panacisegetis]